MVVISRQRNHKFCSFLYFQSQQWTSSSWRQVNDRYEWNTSNFALTADWTISKVQEARHPILFHRCEENIHINTRRTDKERILLLGNDGLIWAHRDKSPSIRECFLIRINFRDKLTLVRETLNKQQLYVYWITGKETGQKKREKLPYWCWEAKDKRRSFVKIFRPCSFYHWVMTAESWRQNFAVKLLFVSCARERFFEAVAAAIQTSWGRLWAERRLGSVSHSHSLPCRNAGRQAVEDEPH